MDDYAIEHAAEQYKRDPKTQEELEAVRLEAIAEAERNAAADKFRPILEKYRPVSIEAERLAEMPARQWSIEGMVPRGETTIIGARKGLGKSWLALQIGAAVASGAPFLGLRSFKGSVLYWPSEIDRTGVHERASRLGELPLGFDVMYEPVPRGAELLAVLPALIQGYGYSMIIIDMLQAALPRGTDTNDYGVGDYLLDIRRVAFDTGAAIIGSWHNGKGDQADPVLSLIGSTGIGAQFGSIITIDRKRGEEAARIFVSGNHALERTIKTRFSEGLFILSGEEDDPPRIPPADKIVLEAVLARPDGVYSTTLAGTISKEPGAVRAALSRLGRQGLVEKRASLWYPVEPHHPHESAQGSTLFAGQNAEKSARTAPAPLGAVRTCASPMPEPAVIEQPAIF
ncbi:MAG: AAA family ATPase [Spirochaetia bacterium]|jgi:hypothetical protein|nr:AAA family ATPase [Spirochaetia bacterium]